MNIHAKRGELPQKLMRKIKLQSLTDKKKSNNIIGYNWRIEWESTDEDIYDFHLFCISIVKDLFKSDFKTNENGKMIYEQLEKLGNLEPVLEKLNFLFSAVEEEKIIKNIKK